MAKEKAKDFLSYIYCAACVFATIAMIVYCLQKYLLNEDVSSIDYKTFNLEKGDIYPAITLCFEAFNDQSPDVFTTSQGVEVNKSDYINFLNGFYWDERFMEIDYDSVTTRIEDYLMLAYFAGYYSTEYGWREYLFNIQNLTVAPPPSGSYTSDWYTFAPRFYTSYRDSTDKCVSFDIPNQIEPVYSFEILFNASIFSNGIRPFDDKFGVEVHYPNQYLSGKMNKFSWKEDNGNNDTEMQFKVQNIVVIHRRNKPESQCNENWEQDDWIRMKAYMTKVGCQPPHWKRMNDLPNCTSMDEMYKFYALKLDDQKPPCKSIQKVMYAYEELDDIKYNYLGYEDDNRHFKVSLQIEDATFMNIQHVRAFDAQSLIGNAGGYLGLFTGYALLQIPSLFNFVLRCLQKLFSCRK